MTAGCAIGHAPWRSYPLMEQLSNWPPCTRHSRYAFQFRRDSYVAAAAAE